MGMYRNEDPSAEELYYHELADRAREQWKFDEAEQYEEMAKEWEKKRMEALYWEIWEDDFIIFDD